MSARPSRRTAARLATAGATVAATLAGAAALQPAAASASESPEATYLATINQERHDHGLAPLVTRHSLNVIADGWAAHMASSGTLAHNPQLANVVTNWQAIGENVGAGPDVPSLAEAFWNSSEHRANILDPDYSDVGIGAVRTDGVLWITVDFRDPMHPVTPSATSAHRGAARQPGTTTHRHTSTRHRSQHRTLRYGSQGQDVARIQRRLGVTADGMFGPVTQAAVRRFQRHHNHRPTGVVGPRTWRVINR